MNRSLNSFPGLPCVGLLVESLPTVCDNESDDATDPASNDEGNAGQIKQLGGVQLRLPRYWRTTHTDPEQQAGGNRNSHAEQNHRREGSPERPQPEPATGVKSVHDHIVLYHWMFGVERIPGAGPDQSRLGGQLRRTALAGADRWTFSTTPRVHMDQVVPPTRTPTPAGQHQARLPFNGQVTFLASSRHVRGRAEA